MCEAKALLVSRSVHDNSLGGSQKGIEASTFITPNWSTISFGPIEFSIATMPVFSVMPLLHGSQGNVRSRIPDLCDSTHTYGGQY